jgi:hypothetical protein
MDFLGLSSVVLELIGVLEDRVKVEVSSGLEIKWGLLRF